MTKRFLLLLFLAVLFFVPLSKVKAGVDSQNKFGIVVNEYYSQKGATDSSLWKNHLDWASNLVGSGGYIKLFFPYVGKTDVPVETYKQVLLESYSRNLNPIIRVQGGWVSSSRNLPALKGCWERPPQNQGSPYSMTQGQYSEYAQKVVDFIDSLPSPSSGKYLIVELWNEMNYGQIEWCDPNGVGNLEPENYARFYLEVYNRLESLGKPYIILTNGGIGRAGNLEYLKRVLAQLMVTLGNNPSALVSIFKYYSTHIYPPTDSDDKFLQNIHSYEKELDLFKELGVDINLLRVLVTEGGYLRSDSSSGEDDRQAKLNVEMIKGLMSDPRVTAINLFSLDDYTDPSISDLPSLLNTSLFVPTSSGSVNGFPSSARPVYKKLRDFRLTIVKGDKEEPKTEIFPIGTAVSEDLNVINTLSLPLSYSTTYPTKISYKIKNNTPGIKVIYVKVFYSDKTSEIFQKAVRLKEKPPQRVCSPGEVLSLCLNSTCQVGQDYQNPQTQVLGHKTSESCSSGQTFYSCTDVTCPDGAKATGGGCYPDNYSTDCLSHCVSTSPTPIPTPVSSSSPTPIPTPRATLSPTPLPGPSVCADECYADELRINIGKNSSGICDSGYSSNAYFCRAGTIGERRSCLSSEYVCVDGKSSGFYWSKLGIVLSTPTPVPTSGDRKNSNEFVCNPAGTGWTCLSTVVNSCN